MADLEFITMAAGLLRPANDDVAETVHKWGANNLIIGTFRRPRNYKFHKKLFSLLDVAYDAWEPPKLEFRGMPVQKNRDRFRKDCIIAAGYFEPVANLKGEVRAEAKSISFSAMDEDTFNELYNAVHKVVLEKVMRNYTAADLDEMVDRLMGFI